MFVRPVTLGAALSLLSVPVALAVQQAKSRYSTIELAKCTSIDETAWRCDGLPGYPLYVALNNRRTYVSTGATDRVQRSATQSLTAANSLFDGKSQRSAIEWRFVIRDKQTVPYATIVRYFTQDGRGRGEVVVVTRVTERESCQVARIDALANDNAMVLARAIADRQARTFDCSKEPEIAGSTGKSPM